MSPVPVPSGRSAARLVIGSVFVVAGMTLPGLGIAHWLLTLLPAAYPCGETYQVHPACRLADPEAVEVGHALMIAAPAACTVIGAAVAVGTFLRRRIAILPTALAFGLALTAFLTGQAMADTALGDVVPW